DEKGQVAPPKRGRAGTVPAKRKEPDEYLKLRVVLTDSGLWTAAAEVLRD
ncbi:unnamed protein product, partial [marine sediment metagenome]